MPHNPLLTRLGEKFFASLPTTPGVYFMMGANGRLLYIGKAKNLRARLRSYARLKPEATIGHRGRRYDNERLLELVEHIRSIRWEDHPTEAAALLRESELLRGLRPPYNVAGTDEELYLYIGIREVAPNRKAAPTHLDFRINNWPDFDEPVADTEAQANPGAQGNPESQGKLCPKPYEVFGAYRHRRKIKRGYVALLRLLHAYQCDTPRFSYPGRISRDAPPWQYRAKFPEALGPALREFLAGRSLRFLRQIFEGLIQNENVPVFMRLSIQDDIDAVRELFAVGPALTCKLRRQHGLRTRIVHPEQMSEWVESNAQQSIEFSEMTAWKPARTK
jgi:hypothetical protein